MKVLQVIHGYPMRYNAGSEVYTQTLCHALAAEDEVHVFTREEDPFLPDFTLRQEKDPDDPRIQLHLVNMFRTRDGYRHEEVDRRFGEVVDRVGPDVVHIGHLNHLSTSLVAEASRRNIPILYTLHDYWLMCPRGQFLQMHPEDPNHVWPLCKGQEDGKCAERCYARYFSGAAEERPEDVQYWKGWVARRVQHVREMAGLVDLFIAPSRYLLERYRDEFGIPEEKLVYLDYGFDLKRLQGRRRKPGEPFTFGYIGTHIPAKGIDLLLKAFGGLEGKPLLSVWGRERGQETASLRRLSASLPGSAPARVEWRSEYRNQEIMRDVFDHVDAIVVPSIWDENSPLVIHEALQARIPVITADVGGMAEYVQHEVNGLLFTHRDHESLGAQMQRLMNAPDWARQMGDRGYLLSTSGDVPEVGAHARAIRGFYQELAGRRKAGKGETAKEGGPWRITFDTNPDTCNLRCIMCEENSPFRKEPRKGPPRLMPIELVRRTIAEAAPHGLREVIPSTMGEPLLYEHLEEILSLCAEFKVQLNLTTNGTFPRLGARGWAKRIVPVGSDVKISWNGGTKSTQEEIMSGTNWDVVLENVKTFIAIRDAHAAGGGNRCRVTFQVTFMEANIAELADIVRLAIGLGVDRVKGHHLWTHFTELEGQSLRRSPEAIRRWNAAVKQARKVASEHRLPGGGHILIENIFPLEEVEDIAPGGPCPFLGREAWISAQGRFDPCCAPDAKRRTLGDFGSLHNYKLMEIWRGESYRQLATTYGDRALCRSCNMRRPAGVTP